jgi:hypothetical protein
VDFVPEEVEPDKFLIAKRNMGWLWHCGLAHVGMRNLHKLQKDGNIIGLMNRKIGLLKHMKLESKWEHLIVLRTS